MALALKRFQSGQPLLVRLLARTTLEARFGCAPCQKHSSPTNRRSGYSKNIVKTSSGGFEPTTPRDRNGGFGPQIVRKNQTRLADGIDDKIIPPLRPGMNYCDIRGHIAGIYGLDASDDTISSGRWMSSAL